ncbi:hemolysin family protein [Pseudodesulfovibrio portus]|uniref:Ion transporter n=1 Tax=Pseudodesulfovibrio portus TaxID=231439 RepID=A0ABM8AN83_9BACT|nr:hemolysin family protein [Pseudodesulfovibrio portus]BDQ32741.1 ion transporter [Pseudodesulfovibrio portus]
MDEGSDSRFLSVFKKFFGANDQHIEEHILEARADGEIDRNEVSMLLNVLELDEKMVKEIMVPRTDMVCAESGSPVRAVADTIVSKGAHSRIPIFEGTKDHIIGVVHAKDLLESFLHGRTEDSVNDLMRLPFFVNEEERLDEILAALKREKLHMAIVRDEYGGTAGIVTMEDVLEEIVGEIADEYDQGRPEDIRELPNDIYIVSGRVPLDEVSERCDITLESEDVDSIGGFVAAMAGRIPGQGEFYTFDNRRFTVLKADERQIWSIRIEPLETV